MAFPPGSPRSAAWQTFRFATRPLALLDELSAAYGDVFSLRLLGSLPWVVVSSPHHLRAVYTAPSERLAAGAAAGGVFAPLTGWNASLTLDGEAHRRRRQEVQPALAREKVQVHAGLIRALAEEVTGDWPAGRAFPLHPSLQKVTLQVIHRAIFGLGTEGEDGALAHLIGELAVRGMSSLLLVSPALRRDLGRFSPWGRIVDLVRRTDDAFYRSLARRRAAGGTNGGQDVLSVLLAGRGERGGLSDGELRDELVALLLAGHETTHTAMVWVFERLLANPEVAARVREELRSATSVEEIGRLPYLEAVIKESLRWRPVSPICGGRLVRETFDLGGYQIPPGVVITNGSYLLHRRPDLYPEPDAFLPERFLDEPADPCGWTTFGGGDRRCMGFHLAMLEIKVVVATVFERFDLELARPPVRPVARGVHLYPARGLPVVATPRRADGPS